MNWLVLTLLSLIAWALVDVLSKYVSTEDDPDAHLELIIIVGLFLLPTLFSSLGESESGLSILQIIWKYKIWIVVPLCYILDLWGSFFPLKYLEISIVSPVVNTAGVVSVIVLLCYYFATGSIDSIHDVLNNRTIIGMVIITIGLVALGYVQEKQAGKELAEKPKDKWYRYGAIALIIPILAALFEGMEGILAGIVLDPERGLGVGENDYWILYSVVCIASAVVIWIYLFIKNKKPYNPFRLREWPKYVLAILEVVAESWWLSAMADEPLIVAFLSCTYCVFTVIFSRVLLKEKMTKPQYICVTLVIIGIIIVGQ